MNIKEACIMVVKWGEVCWADMPCNNPAAYICERGVR